MSNAGIEFHLYYNGILGWVILTQRVVDKNHPSFHSQPDFSHFALVILLMCRFDIPPLSFVAMYNSMAVHSSGWNAVTAASRACRTRTAS
jgi:hypothetical protein